MKKSIIILLLICVCFSSCGKSTYYKNEKVTLPLKGLFHKENDLIVKYQIDNISLNGYVEDIEAYAFENDTLLKLKAYDITIKLPHLIKENQSYDVAIRYFIYNNSIYPYVNNESLSGNDIKVKTIPHNKETILLWGSYTKEVMTYNIKTKKLNNLVTDSEKKPYKDSLSKEEYERIAWSSISDNSIDDNGDFLFIYTNRNDITDINTGLKEIYLLDIKANKWTEINQPDTEYSLYGAEFIQNQLQLSYHISRDNYKYYRYDPTTNKVTEFIPSELINFIKDYTFNYIYYKQNVKDGSLTIINTKTHKDYTFTMEPSTLIYSSSNSSGEYIIGGYQKVKITGEDENGVIYENPTTSYNKAIINMKTGKILINDNFSYSKNEGFSYETYKGFAILGTHWISDSKIMISYCDEGLVAKLDDDMISTEIIDISEFKELTNDNI